MFCGVPVFADSVKNIFGAKVTGIYSIQTADGKKFAEGAVLNGSVYIPVRAMSEVTGTSLAVNSKEKVIILGTKTTASSNVSIDELNIKKEAAESRIASLQGTVKLYESELIPNAQREADNTKGTESEATYQSRLNTRNEELAKYQTELAEARKQLSEIESQITKGSKN